LILKTIGSEFVHRNKWVLTGAAVGFQCATLLSFRPIIIYFCLYGFDMNLKIGYK